jgi:hypothetical protein
MQSREFPICPFPLYAYKYTSDLDQIPIALIYRLVIANMATERNFVVGEILQATNIKFLIV